MTIDHDRIKQMAQEAGLVNSYGGREVASDDALAKFAALVAEDCARLIEPHEWQRADPRGYVGGRGGVSALDLAANNIRARYPAP